MSTASEVVALLARRGWRLGVAESLTGGALTSAIVDVAGASAVLNGGVVAYATSVKASVLGVDAALLDAHGPVHRSVAEQMADGVRRVVAVEGAAAEVGVSTTGIAGPDSPDGQPVGTVWIGVATLDGVAAFQHVFDGDRAAIRAQSVDAALEHLLEAVRE